jgi:hypothetical protein
VPRAAHHVVEGQRARLLRSRHILSAFSARRASALVQVAGKRHGAGCRRAPRCVLQASDQRCREGRRRVRAWQSAQGAQQHHSARSLNQQPAPTDESARRKGSRHEGFARQQCRAPQQHYRYTTIDELHRAHRFKAKADDCTQRTCDAQLLAQQRAAARGVDDADDDRHGEHQHVPAHGVERGLALCRPARKQAVSARKTPQPCFAAVGWACACVLLARFRQAPGAHPPWYRVARPTRVCQGAGPGDCSFSRLEWWWWPSSLRGPGPSGPGPNGPGPPMLSTTSSSTPHCAAARRREPQPRHSAGAPPVADTHAKGSAKGHRGVAHLRVHLQHRGVDHAAPAQANGVSGTAQSKRCNCCTSRHAGRGVSKTARSKR